MTRWALCVVVLVAVPLLSAQQSDSLVEIKTGFVTGQAFLEMNSAEQGSYAPGVVDGILLAPLFGAPKEKLLRVERCIVGMTNSQVAALLVAHLKAHPEEWHQSAHGSMYRALKERCPP